MDSPEKQPEVLFPSKGILDSIEALRAKNGAIDASPTQFIGWTPEKIAEFVTDNLDGKMAIDVSKASGPERDAIKVAAEIEGVDITILDFEAEQDVILRAIVTEIVEDCEGDVVNVGRKAYNVFIRYMFDDEMSFTDDLIVDEWNKYIVNHPHTGQIETPYESHHFKNVGLKTRSQGPDELRDKVEGLIKGVMTGSSEDVEGIFAEGNCVPHRNDSMNTPDARSFLLGNAEFSNFVRSILKKRLGGEDYVEEYEPRKIAAEMIGLVNEEVWRAMQSTQ